MTPKRRITKRGYAEIYVGAGHHLAKESGWAPEHRVVGETVLGRKLRDGELVHHRDHTKANNAPSNLEALNRADHCRHHNPRQGTGSLHCPRGHLRNKPGECRICERAMERARYVPKPRDIEAYREFGRRVGAITGARQKAKTHCPSGHPYDEQNTRIEGNRRICKACVRARVKRRRERIKANETN